MARINWTNICGEIAKANNIEIFKVTYKKHGEIKTGLASKKQIEMMNKFGIEVLAIAK